MTAGAWSFVKRAEMLRHRPGASYGTTVRALVGTTMSRYGLGLPPMIAAACAALNSP